MARRALVLILRLSTSNLRWHNPKWSKVFGPPKGKQKIQPILLALIFISYIFPMLLTTVVYTNLGRVLPCSFRCCFVGSKFWAPTKLPRSHWVAEAPKDWFSGEPWALKWVGSRTPLISDFYSPCRKIKIKCMNAKMELWKILHNIW